MRERPTILSKDFFTIHPTTNVKNYVTRISKSKSISLDFLASIAVAGISVSKVCFFHVPMPDVQKAPQSNTKPKQVERQQINQRHWVSSIMIIVKQKGLTPLSSKNPAVELQHNDQPAAE